MRLLISLIPVTILSIYNPLQARNIEFLTRYYDHSNLSPLKRFITPNVDYRKWPPKSNLRVFGPVAIYNFLVYPK
jgi:hypothetical protein